MKIKAIDASSTHARLVLITDPPLNKEVFDRAKLNTSEEAFIQIEQSEDKLVVTGRVWPPSPDLFRNTEQLIGNAYREVTREKENERANHMAVVQKFSEVSGLPIHDENNDA